MNPLSISSAVSTNDTIVKLQLRELGEPICYFGEDQLERRERLSNLLLENKNLTILSKETIDSQERQVFFSQGTDSLTDFRRHVLSLSIKNSYNRLKRARNDSYIVSPNSKNVDLQSLSFFMQNIRQSSCEICDSRYVFGCKISPSEDKVVTYGLSGELRIWDANTLNFEKVLKYHKYNITDVCWMKTNLDSKLVSSDTDANIVIWDTEKIKKNLIGHEDQINKISIHPFSNHLFSASSDETWRIWDVESSNQIQIQEGHSRPIFGFDIHPDGALVISGDTGGIFRIWDIRTGRTIMNQIAHSDKIVTAQFSPSIDATFITSSQDNYIKLWDLRKTNSPLKENLLGHSKLISKVQFEPMKGRYIISVSYDESIKIWSTLTLDDKNMENVKASFNSAKYSCIKQLEASSHKATGLDIFPSGNRFVTVGLDRTIRIWSCE
ncbi:U4/U6 small nuclear ribonucleoprotein PRP4-like protein [Cryptosporidium felis]|nr:U4/U6 small nuclear ribonucleoprotein PRP4-like protein [Cryptosporidium felis]